MILLLSSQQVHLWLVQWSTQYECTTHFERLRIRTYIHVSFIDGQQPWLMAGCALTIYTSVTIIVTKRDAQKVQVRCVGLFVLYVVELPKG